MPPYSASLDGLLIRRRMGRKDWSTPKQFGITGDGGWALHNLHEHGSIIVTSGIFVADSDTEWAHASIAFNDRDPTYSELKRLHAAVWGDNGWAVQIFPPDSDHVNIHNHALHLWGRLDGARFTPDFAPTGSI